jgi:hypothetical protein
MEIFVKRILTSVAALALMSGLAVAQQQSPQDAARQGNVATPGFSGTPGAGDTGSYQPADPEQAARKGTINQPNGAGSNRGAGTDPSLQPSDGTQMQRRGMISQPSGVGGTVAQ